MTAVLQPSDALRKDRMASFDDNVVSYSSSSTDWKTKYLEVADMLAETRAELDDFHHSSKELEEELERELERTEKAQQDLKVKVARAEQERDEWKSKFMSLQTTHNTTTTSLQRELDTLRADHQKIRIQLRELEMGNDDLERNERAISSSLADVEGKYARALEEKILLEHELLDKANVEEESQRLRDELRDANEEITIMKDQLAAAQSRPVVTTDTGSSAPSSVRSSTATSVSEDNLLGVLTPPDLCLSDLSPGAESLPKIPSLYATPRAIKSPSTPATGQSNLFKRSGYHPIRSALATPPNTASPSLSRSSTVPSFSSTPTRLPPKTPVSRPTANRNASTTSSSSVAGVVPVTVSKSKGVQMVSEMRARVKVLEQKIHTRVPRLRMGSVTNRASANAMLPPPPPPPKAGPSSAAASPAPSTSSMRSVNDERTSNMKPRRQSIDSEGEHKRTPVGDSSGWVLIMEDSPSPVRDKDKERRRTSSPSAPSAFRPIGSAPHESPSAIPRAPSALSQSIMPSGSHRPQSRLSVSTEGRSSVSTNATTSTTSSIPTPSSRPSTPTFLPIPTYGGAATGLKLSTGPSVSYSQLKRSSLGNGSTRSPATSSPNSLPPAPHSNVTVRLPSKIAVPGSLSQSRIGRPVMSGRRSVGESPADIFLDVNGKGVTRDASRARSGSAAVPTGRGGP
ncbi:uncharacterized protein FIBRA_00987 [Fibroporia radiculosa]|uniref:NUDE domain-containing protein n=1 Tax=Fibroporia radiculosa TaxID=599839 RepID=J4H0U9_9APHY|nr:uncharacterized protein FIBRA_00987 [Fibroporia radiculosa]CCL98979.1 predicted protein [Fibroporia radiculosa]